MATTMRRILLRLAIVVAVLIVGLVGAGLVLVHTAWFAERVRVVAEEQANRYVEGDVTLGRLSGSVLGRLSVEDVRIEQDGHTVVSVERLEVGYRIAGLFGPEVTLERLRAVRPVVHARRDGAGWNLARLVRPQGPSGGSARTVRIHALELVGGEATIAVSGAADTALARLPRRIEALDSRLALEIGPDALVAAIDALDVRLHAPDLEVRDLAGTIARRGDVLEVRDLAFATAESRVRADVTYESGVSPAVVRADVRADPLSMHDLGLFVPEARGRRLEPRVRLSAKGPLDALRVEGRADDARAGAIGLDLEIDVDGTGRAARGTIELAGLDLAPLLDDAGLRSRLTGTVEADLRLHGSLQLEHLEGRVEVEADELAVAGYAADRLAATADVHGRTVELGASMRAYAASLQAAGSVTIDEGAPRYDLRGRLEGLDLRRLPARLRVPALSTELAGRVTARGEGETLVATVTFDRSVVEGTVIAPGGTAGAEVGAGETIAYRFDGAVSALDLQRLGRALDVEALSREEASTELAGRLRVDGSGASLETLMLTASADLDASTVLGASFDGTRIEATVGDRRLRATGAGRFDGLDPARLTDREGVAGALDGRFDLAADVTGLGSPDGVELVAAGGTLALDGSSVGDLAVDTARLEAEYADRVVRIGTLVVNGPAIEVQAQGPLALGDTGDSRVEYQLSILRAADLSSLVGRELEGSLSTSGSVTGRRASLRTAGTLEVAGLHVGDQVDVLSGRAAYDVALADLDPGTIDATVDFESVLVHMAGRDLRGISGSVGYADPEMTFDVTVMDAGRTATAVGRVLLHADHREVHVERLALAAGEVSWANREGRELTFRYGDGLLTANDVHLVGGGTQELVADGTLGLDGAAEGTLDVRLQGDLDGLGQLLLLDRQLAGRLEATAQVSSGPGGRQVEGTVTVGPGAVDEFMFQSIEGTASYTGNAVRIDATMVPAAGASLTVEGDVPTAVDGAMDLSVTSTPMALSLVSALTPALTEVEGQMQVELDLSGTRDAPLVSGMLAIADGAFTVEPTGVRYDSLDVTMLFGGNSATIDQLRLATGGDTLDVSGRLMAEGLALRDVELVATADDFQVLDNDLGSVEVSGELEVRGTIQAPTVGGRVYVDSGTLEVDTLLERFTSDAYAAEPDGAEETDRTGPYDELTLDVAIEIPDNLLLRGTDLRGSSSRLALGDVNMTVGGEFDLDKEPGGELVLRGRMNTVRGTYDFQGRRFTVQRGGTVVFAGERPIDPALDVRADREITGVVAHVDVSGTPRRPQVSLSSDPPLDQADILSLIVFNRPANQLGAGEQVSLEERAASFASGLAVSPLAESLGRALDVDLLELEAVTEGGGPAVTVEEQVGERAFVRFRQRFGSQDVSEFMLDYRLADFLRLQGSIAEGQGTSDRSFTRRVERGGIDLIVFFSY